MGPQKYLFTERLLTADAEDALDIGICTISNFNQVLAEMTKHSFQAHAFDEHKRY